MMNRSYLLGALFLVAVLGAFGCTPRTFVKKSPDDNDRGIRYYRPKPYLMVKPATDKNGAPVPGYVSIETTMLPDFSEEYSIHVRSGLGTNDTSITLDQGWNLTQLNVDVDSNVDDNLKAIAEVAKAVPTSGGIAETRTTVKGMNVPFGLYEAVISGHNCKKRLYGFRYIGFMPYSSCPVEYSGCDPHDCNELNSQIFGLVFDQEANVMVFKNLQETQHLIPERKTVSAPDLADPTNSDVNDGIEDQGTQNQTSNRRVKTN